MTRQSALRLAFEIVSRRDVNGPTNEVMLLINDIAELLEKLPDNIRPLRPAVPDPSAGVGWIVGQRIIPTSRRS